MATMKVVAITGERACELVEKPVPRAKDEFAVVKVQVAPMCTEYKAYLGGKATDRLGHEAAGEIAEVGRACALAVGDRVAVMPQYVCGRCALCVTGDYIHCQEKIDVETLTGNTAGTATYAQYLVKQDWLLLPLPDDVSYEHGSMACCGLGPTFGAMQRMCVDAFDTVLITGMGPVGLGGVINATYRGARVIVVEPNPFRANLAKELGAVAAVEPGADALDQIMSLTQGRGPDKAIDCTGASAAQRLLIDATRRRGHIAFVGEGGPLELVVSRDMIRKGLSLHGCWHWNLRDTPRMMQVIRQCGRKLDILITHEFAMPDVGQAWDLQIEGNCGKVLLKPWG